MRVFAGGIATETNVFSPFPTGASSWSTVQPDAPLAERGRLPFFGPSFLAFAARAEAYGDDYVQGSYSFATPSGPTPTLVWESLRDGLLAEIAAAEPLDAVLLTLHGAMAAHGYEDCECDLMACVRALLPNAAIGAVLDPHCDAPPELLDAADLVICFKEYPHIDVFDRSTELYELVRATASGSITPVPSTFDCRMISMYPTQNEPMASFVRELENAEAETGVLSISLVHGFPWGDTPYVGSQVLVFTDNRKPRGAQLAEQLGRRLFELRHHVVVTSRGVRDAFDEAFALQATSGPVVVADRADNAGGGAPSDSTFALAELLRREATDVALALLWDPVVVDLCLAAGEGALLDLRVGGKMGPFSGSPLDVRAKVMKVVLQLVQWRPQQPGTAPVQVACGDSAWLRIGGVDVIVNSIRTQVFGQEVFTAFGIDPRDRRVLVVKSMNHFAAAFAPIALRIIYMASPGALSDDPAEIPYTRTDRNKWPIVDDPWSLAP